MARGWIETRLFALLASSLVIGCTVLNPLFGDGESQTDSGEASAEGVTTDGAGTTSGSGAPDETSGATASQTSGTSKGDGSSSGAATSDSSGAGTFSSSAGEETETGSTPIPIAPPCQFDAMDEPKPVVCYDFAARDVGEDRMANANLEAVAGERTDTVAPWLRAVDCTTTGCAGMADGVLLPAGFTLEVWGRLTDLGEVEPLVGWNVFSIASGDDFAAVDVAGDGVGDIHWRADFNGHRLVLGGTHSAEYFCVGLRWIPGTPPRATVRSATANVRPDGDIGGAQSVAQFGNASLSLGADGGETPVEILGVRVWDFSSPSYCDLSPPG